MIILCRTTTTTTTTVVSSEGVGSVQLGNSDGEEWRGRRVEGLSAHTGEEYELARGVSGGKSVGDGGRDGEGYRHAIQRFAGRIENLHDMLGIVPDG